MIVIPAINETSFSEIMAKIAILDRFMPDDGWFQLDIADGIFTRSKTWANPDDLATIQTRLGIELHIMVESVEKVLDSWLRALERARSPRKRLVAHIEAMGDTNYVMRECARYGVELGLALNPGTSVDLVGSYADRFALIQLLAVDPGAAGQSFDSRIIDKIKALRAKSPNAIIEIDGGVNPGVASRAKSAGANIIVASSYIFKDPSPKGAYEELSRV